MPAFKSISASIVVDGKPLDEYNIETSEADGLTTVTCWIPSECGKRYEVRWGDSLCKRPLDGQVVVDGIRCGGTILKKRSKTVIKTGLRVSPTSIRPFEFSRLNLTDSDTSELTMNVGEIELQLRYWLVDTNSKRPRIPSRGKSSPAERVFNEKAKKGIDHQTTFGDVVHSGRKYQARGKADGKSFLHFHFRYRPLDVLRAHGIAPPAEPTASNDASQSRKRRRNSTGRDVKPNISEVIELSDDDDPQREIEKLQARIAELKGKRSDDRKRVKREPNVKREMEVSSGPFFIDLT